MACGGCGGGGNRHATGGESLKKFAYHTPAQLRYLKSLEKPEQPVPAVEGDEQEQE